MTSPVRDRPNILMMEGTPFTAGFVTSLANAIVGCRKYDVDGLGFTEPVGIPLERRREDVYRRMTYYPAQPRTPKNLTQISKLVSGIFSSSDVPAPVGDEPRGLVGHLYRKAWLRDLRACVSGQARDHDLCHWHCFAPENLPVLDALPSNARLIVTLWGSDVYRTHGTAEYKRQLRVARRASLVTVATPELADVFLSKFGRDLRPKMRLVSYGSELVDAIEEFRGERASFLRGIGIDPAKITVLVGHNASPSNQHEAVLREIAKLPETLRCQLAIVIPMTYTGVSADYSNRVRACAEQSGLSVRILDQRLSTPDVAKLRVATDILIHVPTSDQFSAAMCESLVAGTVLITGGWLPYTRLRSSGVQYHEVFDTGEIATKLADVLNNFTVEPVRVQKNAAIVREMMSWQSLVPQWTRVYDELLNGGVADAPTGHGA